MAKGPIYSVPYKRKRQEKTNYKRRLALVKSDKVRLVVRKTNKRIIAQLVEFNTVGDKTIVMISNNDLKKYGYEMDNKNTATAYLVGYLVGKMALAKKIKEAVFDIGLTISSQGNKIYAVLAGAVKAGLNIPHDPKIFPSEERMKGEHVKGYDSSLIEKVMKNIDTKVKA